MKKGLKITNNDIEKIIHSTIKKLRNVKNRGIGKCDGCNRQVFAWMRNGKWCDKCIEKFY